MREFRFILGKRALILFLALLVATGAFIGAPAATRTLAESPSPGSQDISAISADSAAMEGPLLDPSGHSSLLQAGSGFVWTLVPTTSQSPSAPAARCNHAMATTPSGVLLFGGQDDGGIFLNDTWLFNTATNTWGLLDTGSASPSRRYSHAMATTPSGMLLFGGQGVGHGVGYLNDTWLFNTATNTWGKLELTLTITAPSARYLHAMATTPSGVLLFGGQDGSGIFNDTWLFKPGTSTWGLLDTGSASPSGRFSHAMAATPSGDVLLFGGDYDTYKLNDTWLYGPPPSIFVTSPTAGAHWQIGAEREITWTSTGLNSTTLTILLARNGVDFTETITKGLSSTLNSFTWTVTGPGAINAKIRVLQDATLGISPQFTIADAYCYSGTPTTTSDPWLWIDAGTGSGTLWVTPLTPSLTIDPNLNQFLQQTGKRSALFFDIFQEGLTGTLTIVLHFNHQLGEETFQLYLWDETTGWELVPNGTLNLANHTFTITINASLLAGTPFALAGDPAAMPGMSPWALALLSLALLGAAGWWFLRRRRLA